MYSFDRPLAAKRSRRASAIRLEALEQRVTPVLGTGVNVTSIGSASLTAVGNGGAVGPNHFVQMMVGSFRVFNKDGTIAQTKTDNLFWQDAGISSTLLITGTTEGRVIYDPIANRWFVMQINLDDSNNEVFIARSDTADPTGTWKAVFYTGTSGQFAGFPTLGVDTNGVYVGTANFLSQSIPLTTGVTLTSIPRADLLLATPILTNKTTFNQAEPSAMGWAPQVVTNFAASPTSASVIATHYDTFNLINYTEVTGSGTQTPGGASLGTTFNRAIPHNALPGKMRQPDDTRVVSGGDDDRYTSTIYQVGDLIFAAHSISVNASGQGTTSSASTTNGIQLIVIRDSTNQVVATGTYFNPNFDYSYPSVAANALGDIVIGVNRSSFSDTDGHLGAYAVYARIDPNNPTTITFGQEIQLQAGAASYHQQSSTNEAWGPYTSIQVDPSNPFAFWTTQQFALTSSAWATKVTEVFVSPRAGTVTSSIADGTYGVGAAIPITITFNHPVVVTGTPQLALNSGGVAVYTGGSGTDTLTFTYTVGAGQAIADLDYSSTTALSLNGGTIKDAIGGVDAELILAAPGTAGSLGFSKNIAISSNVAGVSSVSSTNNNGTYGSGAVIAITVTFNRDVVVTGSPQLSLNTGAAAVYASGSSTNTLTFNYTVAAGQFTNDLDYTSSSALSLNGGTIKDELNGSDAVLTLPAPGAAGSLGANKNIVIDAVAPTVVGVSSTTANGTYGVGANVAITVTFTESVTVTGSPQLSLNSGGVATYSSGSGTAVLTFTYTVAFGQNAADLDYTSTNGLTLNGGTIVETGGSQNANLSLPSPGAAGSLGANKNIVIDGVPPAVTGVNSPTPNGTYGSGASITIVVTFSEAVAVTGTPQLALNSGGTATYTSGSGTTALTFTYTVDAGHAAADLDYLSVNALTGTIVELSSSQNANLTLPAPGGAGSLGGNKNIVIDTLVATVSNVTSPTANGAYAFGAVIDVTVQFNRTVVVTGTPLLTLNSGGIAVYLSGSGTNTLTFRYTVGNGNFSSDLDYASAGALTLGGGTIKDSNGFDATLTLPVPGTAGSLGANKAIVVDAVGPVVQQFRVLFGSKWYNVIGSTRFDLPWLIKGVQVVFSEPVYSGNMQSLGGFTATSFTGLRTRTLTWRFANIAKGTFNTTLASTGANALKDIAGNPIPAFGQTLRVLYGDFTDDGVVNAADEAGVRANMGKPYQIVKPGYNIFADLSGDGLVNLVDVGITKTRKGQSLT